MMVVNDMLTRSLLLSMYLSHIFTANHFENLMRQNNKLQKKTPELWISSCYKFAREICRQEEKKKSNPAYHQFVWWVNIAMRFSRVKKTFTYKFNAVP